MMAMAVSTQRVAGEPELEHPHILVVDDEPQITRVLRTTLSAQGYDVRVANDGELCYMRTPLEYRLLPAALSVVVPGPGATS